MGAVIGTGSYTLLDGSTIRTPGSGVWTVTGQNMENYGVPPDVFVDNTPADFLKGRDAQIEKAVEVLKADLAAPKRTTSQQQQPIARRSVQCVRSELGESGDGERGIREALV